MTDNENRIAPLSESAAPSESASPSENAPPVQVAPVYDNADRRSKLVQLEWPFTLDGVRYEAVRIRRATVQQIREYAEQINAVSEEEAGRFVWPVFDMPQEAFEAVDADDVENLLRAGIDFLPRSFRAGAIEQARSHGDGS